MHRVFQHDLYQLRLNTARAYVSALETSSNPVSSDPEEPIKLTAQVLGLGPMFRLIIGLTNTSASSPSRGLYITFYCDDKLYQVKVCAKSSEKTTFSRLRSPTLLFRCLCPASTTSLNLW